MNWSLLMCVTMVTVIRAQQQVCRVNLVIAVDGSGSVSMDPPYGTPQNWIDIQNFLIEVVDELSIDRSRALVGLLRFDSGGKVFFPIGEMTKEDMKAFIRSEFKYNANGGDTNTEFGLKLARDLLDTAIILADDRNFMRGDVTEVILVITDGKPSSPPNYNNDLANTIAELKSRGVRIIGVGVTDQINTTQLMEMVSDPSTDYFTTDQFDQLGTMLNRIVNSVCEFFTTTTTTTRPDTCPASELAIAFSAHTMVESIAVTLPATIVFELTYTNIGNHYSTSTGLFTCPCNGVYFFTHSWSGVQHGLGTTIFLNNDIVAPLAYIGSHGSASTSATVRCNQGDVVYISLVFCAPNYAIKTLYDDGMDVHALTGWTGYLIEALE